MVVLAEVVIMEFNQRLDCLLHRAHLDQGHLTILLEELESLDQSTRACKQRLQVIFNNCWWDVGEVQGC
uniref:Uncharacterized protein n=1 Tax=Anguilla anguilla TaxID=7936 RepID=A0A0E9R5G9_ANGAN